MGYAIIFIFILLIPLCLLDERIKKIRMPMYLCIGALLILLAGFREVGLDPDSINYENSFLHYTSKSTSESVEGSYMLISQLVHLFTDDVHGLFLVYAFLGVSLKMVAFRKMSSLWFLPMLIYVSYFYELHELTQIRTGVLSGLFLLAIPALAEKRRWQATLIILLGCLFHISGIVLFPLLFLSNRPINNKWKWVWAMVIPIGYVVYVSGMTILMNTSLPYIGNKLALYQASAEKGTGSVFVNVFSPFQMMNILMFYYLFFFQGTISKFNKYFPIMLRIFAVGMFCFTAFAFVPVVGQRLSLLYRTVTIILFSNIYYTMRPKWLAVLLVAFVMLIFLNYSLPLIQFTLFWEV